MNSPGRICGLPLSVMQNRGGGKGVVGNARARGLVDQRTPFRAPDAIVNDDGDAAEAGVPAQLLGGAQRGRHGPGKIGDDLHRRDIGHGAAERVAHGDDDRIARLPLMWPQSLEPGCAHDLAPENMANKG